MVEPQEGIVASELPSGPARQSHLVSPNLSSYVSKEFGLQVARFPAHTYMKQYEQRLREMGVALIIVEQPGEFDQTSLREKDGYYVKAEKVIWRLPVRSFASYCGELTSDRRSRLKAKLEKSSSLKVDISELSSRDFKEWYPIYDTEIAQRERGRRVIDTEWPGDGRDLSSYRKIFIRDPRNGQLLGGAILKLNKSQLTCEIAYVAFRGDVKHHELYIRAFKEALEYSHKNGFRQLSYGMDTNLYGFYLGVGLMEFKASLGFVPIPGKRSQIVKVLNPDGFGRHYAFFQEADGAPMNCHLFIEGDGKIRHPKACPLTVHGINGHDQVLAPALKTPSPRAS